MRYVYTIFDSNYFCLAIKMFSSLVKYNKCDLLIYGFNVTKDQHKELEDKLERKVNIFPLLDSEWLKNKMICKIDKLTTINLNNNDEVFVLDVDMIIQDNIFTAFDKYKEDFLYTSREPHHKKIPINCGIFGFRYNQNTKDFLRFYKDQMINPSWPPYLKYVNDTKLQEKRMTRTMLPTSPEQDFLCAVYNENGILPSPINCTFRDIGPTYNCCFDDHKKVLSNLGNKKYKILHFKGGPNGNIMLNIEGI